MKETPPQQTPRLPPAEKITKPLAQFKVIAVITSFAFLLFLFIAIWIFYQQIQNNQTTQHFYQELQKTQNQIVSHQAQTQQLQETIKNLQVRLDQLSKFTFDPGKQQLLSEITYLINLANLYITLEKDAANSKILLNLALKQINTLNSPVFNPLRDVLKKNIAKLESVSVLDKTVLIFKLDTLNDAIQQMTYTPQSFAIDNKSNITNLIPAVAHKQSWSQHVSDFLLQINDLIKIRRTTHLPFLTSEQQAIVKANLSAKIMQMEWAIIHSNTELYQSNIKLIEKWLNQFFYLSPQLPSILKQLHSFSEINIAPNLPDLSDVFEALSQVSQTPVTKMTPPPQLKLNKNSVANSQVVI